MSRQPPLSPTGRDRGLKRLRRLTIGAAAGSAVAVVGFGALAAASYAGTTGNAAHASTPTATPGGGSSTSPSQTATPTPTPITIQPAATPPVSGSGRTPVASGGS